MCGSCIICFMTARADEGKLDQGSRAEELVGVFGTRNSFKNEKLFFSFFHTLPIRRTCLVLTRGVRILILWAFNLDHQNPNRDIVKLLLYLSF